MKDNPMQTEYSIITDNIMIGTNMCCAHHFGALWTLAFDPDMGLDAAQAAKPHQCKKHYR